MGMCQSLGGLVLVLGEIIKKYCAKNKIKSIGIGQSSYLRTEQTRIGITDRIVNSIKCILRFDAELREKNYGVLDGLPDDRQKELSGLSDEHYKRMPFYAARPGGESDANVVARVRTYLSEIFCPFAVKFDLGVIITHSTTMRAIIVAQLNHEIVISEDNKAIISKKWENWFDNNKPNNCEVWEIKGGVPSVIFTGFDKDGSIAQADDRFSDIMRTYGLLGRLPLSKMKKATDLQAA